MFDKIKWCQSAIKHQVKECRLRIRYGAIALDTTIYLLLHRGRSFTRLFMRVRITVYHFRDIFIYLATDYISNIISIITIQVTITRKRRKTANVRQNTSHAKCLKDFIHIAHLSKFLTANAVTKSFNTGITLCKYCLTHNKPPKKSP